MDGWHVDLSKEQLKDGSQISALGHLVDQGANGQDEKERGGPCSRLLHAHGHRAGGTAPGTVRTETDHKAGRQEPGPKMPSLKRKSRGGERVQMQPDREASKQNQTRRGRGRWMGAGTLTTKLFLSPHSYNWRIKNLHTHSRPTKVR